MATGSEISAVFCEAALITLPRAPFSQYSRPDEVPLFVSQYSVMLSSTSSFVGDCRGWLPNVHCGKAGCIRIPASPGWFAGETVAGQGRDDDIEGVLGSASVRGRISKRPDDLQLLNDGSRPAVRYDHRKRIFLAGAHVDEVDLHAIDVCCE